jgi:hypothetical protein
MRPMRTQCALAVPLSRPFLIERLAFDFISDSMGPTRSSSSTSTCSSAVSVPFMAVASYSRIRSLPACLKSKLRFACAAATSRVALWGSSTRPKIPTSLVPAWTTCVTALFLAMVAQA